MDLCAGKRLVAILTIRNERNRLIARVEQKHGENLDRWTIQSSLDSSSISTLESERNEWTNERTNVLKVL